MRSPFRLALAALLLARLASSLCPNKCSAHGSCSNDIYETCTCYPGWTGPDCSLKACPFGKSWVGAALTTDGLHAQLSECGNMVRATPGDAHTHTHTFECSVN